MKFRRLIKNRDFLLVKALLLGLLGGPGAKWTEKAVLPALGLVMTLATMGVSGSIFLSPRKLVRPALWGIALNYVLLGGVILGLSGLLITEEELWEGFVIMTAVPPAVAVIPFSVILNGNQTFALIGTMGCYLAALGITPLIAYFFLGGALGDGPGKIVTVMVELILVPLVCSRILLWTGWAKKLEPWKGTLTNWSFFLIVYTIIGLNRQLFFERPGALVLPAAIALASTFILGWGIGRRVPENALFPYCTNDKLHDACETTGPKTVLLATRGGRTMLWQPFDAGRWCTTSSGTCTRTCRATS